MTKVYSSVVRFFRFFLFERTSDPALTFKNLCEGFLNSIFELGPVENIKQAKGNECISFGLFNIFQFLSL